MSKMIIYEGSYSYKAESKTNRKVRGLFGGRSIFKPTTLGYNSFVDYEAKEKHDLDSWEDETVRTEIRLRDNGVVFVKKDGQSDLSSIYGSMGSTRMKVEGYRFDEITSITIEDAGVERRQRRLFGSCLIGALFCGIVFNLQEPGLSGIGICIGLLVGCIASFKLVRVKYKKLSFIFEDGERKEFVFNQGITSYYISKLKSTFGDKFVFSDFINN